MKITDEKRKPPICLWVEYRRDDTSTYMHAASIHEIKKAVAQLGYELVKKRRSK